MGICNILFLLRTKEIVLRLNKKKERKKEFPKARSPQSSLHDNTTISKLAKHLGQHFFDKLLDLVLLAALLLVAAAMAILLLSRVSLATAIVRLLRLLVVWLLVSSSAVMHWRHLGRATGEIDIHSSGVFLGRVLQTKLATNLLHARLDFLNVVCRVVPFSDNPTLTQSIHIPSFWGGILTHANGSAHVHAHT